MKGRKNQKGGEVKPLIIEQLDTVDKTCIQQIIRVPKWKTALCWCCDKYSNTENEFRSHRELSCKTQVKYDEDNEQHEALLKEFYDKGQECFSDDQKDNQIPWEVYGFRIQAPRSDFGEAGLHSLEFMAYFIQNCATSSKKLFELEHISFVNVSNLITLRLRSYLLLEKEGNQSPITRKQMKAFVFYLVKDDKDQGEDKDITNNSYICISNKKDNSLLLKLESEILKYFIERLTNIYHEDKVKDKITNNIISKAISLCGKALNAPINQSQGFIESIQILMKNDLKSQTATEKSIFSANLIAIILIIFCYLVYY